MLFPWILKFNFFNYFLNYNDNPLNNLSVTRLAFLIIHLLHCCQIDLSIYVFDWENTIALHAMQGNRASSRGEREVSWVFSSSAGTWGIFSSYDGDAHSKREFV